MEVITRKEALTQGLKRYYTGKPCKHGHILPRMVNGCSCVECNKIKHKKYRETSKRKDYLKGYNKQYRENNKDKTKEYNKQYRMDNIERTKEYNKVHNKEYRENNKDKIKQYNKQHRMDNPKMYKEIRKRASLKYRKAHPDRVAHSARFYLYCKENATPGWYETDLIKQIYLMRDKLSELWGITLHVDHIVPLQGENVCGLHCWDNLQLLEASLNKSKSNNLNN